MKSLSFDSRKFMDAFRVFCLDLANSFTYDMYNDIVANLNTSKGKSDVEVQNAVMHGRDLFVGSINSYANAIVDSYGRGAGIDKDNPFLSSYMSSEYWNKMRGSDMSIVGRSEGPYSTIFGDFESKGKAEGTKLPWFDMDASMAIQNAESDYFQLSGKIDRYIKQEMKAFVSRTAKSCFKYR